MILVVPESATTKFAASIHNIPIIEVVEAKVV